MHAPSHEAVPVTRKWRSITLAVNTGVPFNLVVLVVIAAKQTSWRADELCLWADMGGDCGSHTNTQSRSKRRRQTTDAKRQSQKSTWHRSRHALRSSVRKTTLHVVCCTITGLKYTSHTYHWYMRLFVDIATRVASILFLVLSWCDAMCWDVRWAELLQYARVLNYDRRRVDLRPFRKQRFSIGRYWLVIIIAS